MKPIGERVDIAMKEIEAIVKGVQLNNNFLNDVAKIYERRGHATAKLYVQGKFTERMRQDERKAFDALLKVLDVLHKENLTGPIASFCIKKLNAVNLSKQGGV
ncbi:MAG: hypothetical protein ABI874_09080 [Chloroflexota bacterium]